MVQSAYMFSYYQSHENAVSYFTKNALRSLSRAKATHSTKYRVGSILAAESHIARLRAMDAAGWVHNKDFFNLRDLEHRLRKLKKLPSVTKELAL